MKLEAGQHAFVTGGASGIGLGIAEALAARGLRITLADINAEALGRVIGDKGESWRGQLLDTRDREGWAAARDEAEAAFGPVDVLVNNAGIAPNGQPFADMAPESFDRIVSINLVGVFNGVSAFAAAMRDRARGHIVNTSSQAGLMSSVPGVGAYAVAKYGVTAMSEQLRTELADHGVGVSCLCPGYVQTNLAATTARLGADRREYTTQMPPSSISAHEVGEMVAAGIEENAPFILTHKGVWQAMQNRLAAIRAAADLREGA